jgi:hypothetical protein
MNIQSSVLESAKSQSSKEVANSVITVAELIPARHALAYLNLTAKQLAARLKVPRSWVLDNSNPNKSQDPIPHLVLGSQKRFRWGSPELAAWINRHVVCPSPLTQQDSGIEYDLLDSAELAARLNISESWVRDQVRTRASDPIPHARFGRYVRFRWGSPELETWAERRMLFGNNRVVSRAHGTETIQ